LPRDFFSAFLRRADFRRFMDPCWVKWEREGLTPSLDNQGYWV